MKKIILLGSAVALITAVLSAHGFDLHFLKIHQQGILRNRIGTLPKQPPETCWKTVNWEIVLCGIILTPGIQAN